MICPRMFDSILYPVITMLASAFAMLLGQAVPNAELLFLLLLPFIGSMIVAWLAMWMNPTAEKRQVTGARVGFALFFGTLGPSILAYFVPDKMAAAIQVPQVLVFVGGVIAFVVYILSYPFCLRQYANAKATAEALADRSTDALAAKVGGVVAKEAVKVAALLKDEPLSPEALKGVATELLAQATEGIKDSPQAALVIEVVAESTAKKVEEKLRH